MSADQRYSLHPATRTTSTADAIRAVDPDSVRERNDWPLFDRMLHGLALRSRELLLDAGCASGLLCAMATGIGAKVVGVDPSPLHVTTARRRNPRGEFHVGRLEELPFADARFDAVTLVNALQRCTQPTRVLRELRRVLRGSGRLALVAWGDPRGCENAICFESVRPADDEALVRSTGPYAYAASGAVVDALLRADLRATLNEHVSCTHAYADVRAARQGLVGGGHAPDSWRLMSENEQMDRLAPLLEPYRAIDGSYALRNTFRLVVARPTR